MCGEGRRLCMRETCERERRSRRRDKGKEVVGREKGSVSVRLWEHTRRMDQYTHAWRKLAEHTSPKPFSLSSSNTIVSLFKYTTPGLFRSCGSNESNVFTKVFGSTLRSTV